MRRPPSRSRAPGPGRGSAAPSPSTTGRRSPPAPGSPPASLEARYETVDGHRLRYVRAGAGPAVVLVHGFGSSLYTWKDVIPALAARHDVVALDLPGFGQSDQPADLSFEDFPRAVLGLMDALGIERAALVGNSMGGATAAVVAAEHPERVSALVLIDAAGFNLGPSRAAGHGEPCDVPRRLAPRASCPASASWWRRRCARSSTTRPTSLPSASRSTWPPSSRPGTLPAHALARRLARGPAGTSSRGRCRASGRRTLVLWGGDDRWIPLAHADRFVAAIPGSRKVVIPDCGHVPQEEKPRRSPGCCSSSWPSTATIPPRSKDAGPPSPG